MTGNVTQKSHCRDKKISVELARHLFYSDIGVTLSFLCGVITMNLFTGRQARSHHATDSLKWLWVVFQIILFSSITQVVYANEPLSEETSSEIHGRVGPTEMGGGWAEASATFYRDGLLMVQGHARSDSLVSGVHAAYIVVGVDRKGRAIFVSNLLEMPTVCSKMDTCSHNVNITLRDKINHEIAKYLAKINVYATSTSQGRSVRESVMRTLTEACATYDDLPAVARAAIAYQTGFPGCNPLK
jgi:hypothetical protein